MSWVEDEISFAVPEDLEPGTMASFQLAPNLFGTRGLAPYNRDDMILHLTPYHVEDIVGTLLIPGADVHRLSTLYDLSITRVDVESR